MLKYLIFKSLRKRILILLLCVLSIFMSAGLYFTVKKARVEIESHFINAISDVDLIIGARAGSLQLLLYTIFHLGEPTNNISYKSYKKIKNHPAIKWTIPISLGDSYQGYRVVATNQDYFKFYRYNKKKRLQLDNGQWFNNHSHVVLGATVAQKLKHRTGDSIILSHGVSAKQGVGLDHSDNPFKVIGILKKTGTAIDKSVFINLQAMEKIHMNWMGNERFEKVDLSKVEPELLTSFILRTKSRIATLSVQRYINTLKDEPLSAIIPAMALSQLWSIMDNIEIFFDFVIVVVFVVSLVTIFVLLTMSYKFRKNEFRLLKSMGSTNLQVSLLFICEILILILVGLAGAQIGTRVLFAVIQ